MIQTAVHCLQLPDSSTVQSCSFCDVQNSNCVVVLALHYITFNTLKCKLRRGAVGNEVHLGWLLLGEWSTSHLPNEWTWENTAGKIKKEYKIGKYQISSGTQNVPAGGWEIQILPRRRLLVDLVASIVTQYLSAVLAEQSCNPLFELIHVCSGSSVKTCLRCLVGQNKQMRWSKLVNISRWL